MDDGVWRTIRGRRVFIGKGETLGQAMAKSGKFTRNNMRGAKFETRLQDKMNKNLSKKQEKRYERKFDKEDSYKTKYTGSQDKKNQINEQESIQRDYDTRVKQNYNRYAERDRRELRHEELQKKLADFKAKKQSNNKQETYEEYKNRLLNDDNYLQANRPNEYFRKTLNEQSNNKVENENYYKGTKRWGFGYANDDNIPVYDNKIDYSGDFTHANLSKVSNEDLQNIVNTQTKLYNEATNRQVGDRRTYNGKKDQLFKDVETLRYSNGMKVAKEEIVRRENEKRPQYKGTDYEVKYASVKDAFDDPNSKIRQFIDKKRSNRKNKDK